MANDFKYDVFLSHSSKDKAVVRPLAERLRADGLRVWFDEWVLKPGDSLPKKLDEGLEESRVLVLCMSAQAFGSDWAQLEAGTFRFRDPLNQERRFIPLRLDATPVKGALAQFIYINWLPDEREQEYAKLLEACRPPIKPPTEAKTVQEQATNETINSDSNGGRVLQFPVKNTALLPKRSSKSAKRNNDKTVHNNAQASATYGAVSIAIVGSNQGNISITMPTSKSSGIKYPANSIGADANLTNYIEYLCDLYVKFMRPIEPDDNKSWAKIGSHIKTKFRLRKKTRNHLSIERFPDLVDYLVNEKLAKTPVGKKHLRDGKRLCRTFEEFRHGVM